MPSFNTGKSSYFIDSKELFSEIDQLDCWGWLLKKVVKVGEKFCNPFRHDPTPGAYLYWFGDLLLLSDFSDRRFHGKSIVQVVMLMEYLSYKEAINYIHRNYYLTQNRIVTKKVAKLERQQAEDFQFRLFYKRRLFNLNDKRFWGDKFCVPKNFLDSERVIPNKSYTCNSKAYPFIYRTHQAPELSYAINIDVRTKLYMPKDKKFISTLKMTDIGGVAPLNLEDSVLIITKSFKDYAVLTLAGFNCRYILAESIRLPLPLIEWADRNFDLVIILMDNDDAGRKAASRMEAECRIHTKSNKFFGMWFDGIPKVKDPANIAEHYSLSKLHKEVSYLVQLCYDTKNSTQQLDSAIPAAASGS